MKETMRAMGIYPDGAKLVETPKPEAGSGEARVKVVCAGVNPGEKLIINKSLMGRFLHAQTSPLFSGWDYAGIVDQCGKGVTDLTVGDAVFGHLAFKPSQKQGTFSEYVIAQRSTMAQKPLRDLQSATDRVNIGPCRWVKGIHVVLGPGQDLKSLQHRQERSSGVFRGSLEIEGPCFPSLVKHPRVPFDS